jgi:hypothetical protein
MLRVARVKMIADRTGPSPPIAKINTPGNSVTFIPKRTMGIQKSQDQPRANAKNNHGLDSMLEGGFSFEYMVIFFVVDSCQTSYSAVLMQLNSLWTSAA